MKEKANADLIYQVVRAKMLNKKRPSASTKDRSEVRGSGKKPWQQKGTGRARAGSVRSPLWEGGGITFGPRPERNYQTRVPKKIARKAFNLVLQKKEAQGEVIVTPKIDLPEAKTKFFAAWLKKFVGNDSSLVVVQENIEMVKRAGRNIPRVRVLDPANVDILDVLSYKYLVATKEAFAKLKERSKAK